MSVRISSLSDFLALLKGVKRARDGQYLTLCPGHHDTKQSLSVKETGGKILLKCHAGCDLVNILKPLGLRPKDLFLNSHKTELEHREIEAIYHYTDAKGKPFEVVRTRPKGFYQRRSDGKGGYIHNLKGIVPMLYHQDKLRQAIDSAERIYFVEGEKDCDNLWAIGLVATTNPMGAGKWRDRYAEAFRRADLIIEKVIRLWRAEGAPVIHLGPDENSEKLDLLLSNSNVLDRHLKAISEWIEKQTNRPGKQGS